MLILQMRKLSFKKLLAKLKKKKKVTFIQIEENGRSLKISLNSFESSQKCQYVERKQVLK